MKVILQQIGFVYALTLIICSSSLLDPLRQWIIVNTPYLYSPLTLVFKKYHYPVGLKHFIECRLCMSFWVTLACCYYLNTWTDYFIVVASAYFLATQER